MVFCAVAGRSEGIRRQRLSPPPTGPTNGVSAASPPTTAPPPSAATVGHYQQPQRSRSNFRSIRSILSGSLSRSRSRSSALRAARRGCKCAPATRDESDRRRLAAAATIPTVFGRRCTMVVVAAEGGGQPSYDLQQQRGQPQYYRPKQAIQGSPQIRTTRGPCAAGGALISQQSSSSIDNRHRPEHYRSPSTSRERAMRR